VELASNHIVLGVGGRGGEENFANFHRGLKRKRLGLKKILLTDLKYVLRITKKQAEFIAREADRLSRQEHEDLSDDSSSDLIESDTDDEASKEVFV
jgi:hypothetical protein